MKKLKRKFPKEKVIGISVKTGKGLKKLKEEIWKITGLMRVYPSDSGDPMILKEGSTVEDFARKVHKKVLKNFRKSIINGPSAKFPDQRVGLDHELKDKDTVKIIT